MASWFRSRSRRPRTLPSMSRSPTRTMSPPISAGSTSVSSATRPPVSSSRRAAIARTSSSVSGAALVAVAWVDPVALVVEAARTRRRRAAAARSGRAGRAAGRGCGPGGCRLGEHALRARRSAARAASPGWRGRPSASRPPTIAAAASSSRRQTSTRPVAGRDLEGGLGVAARRGVAAGHQLARRRPRTPAPASARNSSTSRRWRSVGHRLADDAAGGRQREVGDLAAQLGRSRAASRPRSRRSPARAAARARPCVAAMSASRDSWATFWARVRMSFASRRASWSAARRSASADSRSLARLLGVAQALLDPLPGARSSIRVTGLSRTASTGSPRRTTKLSDGDDDPEQVDLEPPLRLAPAASADEPCGDAAAIASRSTMRILRRPLA